MGLRLDRGVAAGTFSLDGQVYAVENNLFVLGDDDECLVIDAPHDLEAIARLVGSRRLVAILCTHAHDDHIRVAPALAERFSTSVLLHPADEVLWREVHPHAGFEPLRDGTSLQIGGTRIEVLHTPGHSPGGVCAYVTDEATLFSGDTLFQGGPGATGRSYSDFPTIIDSITRRLLVLDPGTVVHPGHGADTTIGDEAPHLSEWLARGH